VIRRYDEEIARMDQIMSEQFLSGMQIVLTTPIDNQGEFMSQPFVDRIKEVTSELMSVIRG
jgi:hypothetical protein